MDSLGQNGVLQVIPPAMLEAQLEQQAQDKAAAAQPGDQQDFSELVGYIKTQFEIMRNHRNSASGWNERLLRALRAFNGQYDATKLREIRRFSGSEVYARVIAQKCRAASSLLRDIYLGQDRPWALEAPPHPDVPHEIVQQIDQLLQQEQQMVAQHMGGPPPPSKTDERRRALMSSAEDAAKKKTEDQAQESEDRIEDLLRNGGFYHALAEFLIDVTVFPFAVMKGPVVKVFPEVVWPEGGGMPTVEQRPRLTWCRVSPFDVWWTPGVADIEDANVIEKERISRGQLNDLLDLPGYNVDEIRKVLDEYGRGGLYDNWDTTDAERAVLENRENPAWNRSGLLTMMTFNGQVQGRLLQEYGLAVQDELRDYSVQCWCIGPHVIKAQLNPSPRQRHPYFVTSFEKVPGTPVGNGLTDLLDDIQEAANATLRALCNNMGMASGPQTVVNDDRLSPEENGEEMYPWKRWHVRNDPTSTAGQKPIDFFQPQSNAQELMQVFKYLVELADDVSAIPKYIGGQAGGGAGRTASGLAMLMGNASKILQTVSANIDRDMMEPALTQLTDLIMLTDDSGLLSGLERVSVRGVNVAVQRETMRQRQMEFLQATINPTDMKIMGIGGRAKVLRAISQDIGLPGQEVVPPEDQIEKMEQAEKQQQANGGGFDQQVQEGIHKGVEAGVQRISTELTAGLLAQRASLPEGMPTHLGTVPQGGPPGAPSASSAPPGVAEHDARQGMGMKPPQISQGGMGPQTHLVGNQPAGPPKLGAGPQ